MVQVGRRGMILEDRFQAEGPGYTLMDFQRGNCV